MTTVSPVSPADFRQAFPAFASVVDYPDESVAQYLLEATIRLNASRFGDLLNTVIGLYAAHHLAAEFADKRNAARGAAPGQQSGALTSKSVGGISASYAGESVIEQGAGFWNQTQFGRRLYRLLRLGGMGGVQLT